MNFPRVSIIVAHDHNLAIGKGNEIPWHLSADLQYFKQKTMGKTIIMGLNTFASLGYRQLPGRKSIVITSHSDVANRHQVTTYSSLESALADTASDNSETMIIGGGKLYSSAIKYASRLYVTLVDTVVDGADTFFVPYENDFSLTWSEEHCSDEKNQYNYIFRIYERI